MLRMYYKNTHIKKINKKKVPMKKIAIGEKKSTLIISNNILQYARIQAAVIFASTTLYLHIPIWLYNIILGTI